MQTRLMSSHGIRLAIGSLALCFANSAGAQESLERGKSAAQLYAANCASCHKSPQSVTKATGIFDLESFLREHYTPSLQSAATLAAYLKGLERQSSGPVRARGDAQDQPPPPPALPPQRSDTFTPDEVIRAGHNFFGTVSSGLAKIVEEAFSRWGQPNGYVLGQQLSGAFVVGVRYGDGTLYTRNAGDRRVFWQGPSVGYDAGGEGSRTMMLVYNLPATDAIYERFVGIDGSAYVIGGFGMTALGSGNIIVVPIRSGVGLRLGANIGYLKFTPQATWNPF
jgi:hypothetical protein